MAITWALMLLVGLFVVCVRSGGDAALSAMLAGAGEAVALSIELAGGYLLFMGMMGIAERAGLMESLSNRLRPVTRFLFPREEQAGGAIAAAFAANMLGLGNAATPLGLAAMRELEKTNPRPGVATNGMCVFLAVNGSCLQVLPTGLIALRQAAGSASPASIVLPSLIASAIATLTAVVLCKLLCSR